MHKDDTADTLGKHGPTIRSQFRRLIYSVHTFLEIYWVMNLERLLILKKCRKSQLTLVV